MSKKSEVVEEKVESTEVAVSQGTALAAPAPAFGYGAADDIGTQDIKIERVLLTQAMSKKVLADEVEKGLLVLQSNMEELARFKKTDLEFIPIKAMKYWIESDKDSKEFIARYPALSPDEHEWEEKRGARTIKRTYTHSFIALLPSKIASMEDVPLEIAFRSTNLECAKSINTKLLNMKRRNLPSWNKVFKLKIDTKSNAQGTWYITTDSISRDSTQEEIFAAESWAKILHDAKIKLDDNDGLSESSNLPPLNQEESDY
jgi:hypothetical protein